MRLFKPKEHFLDVLTNIDDQVLVRQLLLEYVPADIKQKVVDTFNRLIQERHEKRMQDEEWPESINIVEGD